MLLTSDNLCSTANLHGAIDDINAYITRRRTKIIEGKLYNQKIKLSLSRIDRQHNFTKGNGEMLGS